MNHTLSLPVRRMPSRRTLILLAVIVVAVIAAATFFVIRANQPEMVNGLYGVKVPVSPEIEERFGVRVMFAALTGRDGIIDLRYRVIDPGKAVDFGHYSETSPMLVTPAGTIMSVTKMGLHNHRIEPGLVFHVLYRNTANAVKHGMPITVKVGDMELKNVVVQ